MCEKCEWTIQFCLFVFDFIFTLLNEISKQVQIKVVDLILLPSGERGPGVGAPLYGQCNEMADSGKGNFVWTRVQSTSYFQL